MKSAFFIGLLAMAPAWVLAQGQSVWRCGADGRSYSDVPCLQGKAVEMPTARPAADIDEAKSHAAREKLQAQAIEREQQRRDRTERHSGLSGFVHIQPNAQAKADAKPTVKTQRELKPGAQSQTKRQQARQQKQKQPTLADAGTWQAVVPGSRHTKD